MDGIQLDIYVPFGLQTGNAANGTSVPQGVPGMNVSDAMSFTPESAGVWLPQSMASGSGQFVDEAYDELTEGQAMSDDTASLADNDTAISGMSQDMGNISGSYETGNWYKSPDQNWFTPDTSRISASIGTFKNGLILKFKSMIP